MMDEVSGNERASVPGTRTVSAPTPELGRDLVG